MLEVRCEDHSSGYGQVAVGTVMTANQVPAVLSPAEESCQLLITNADRRVNQLRIALICPNPLVTALQAGVEPCSRAIVLASGATCLSNASGQRAQPRRTRPAPGPLSRPWFRWHSWTG